jgi:DNA-binding SARP family transcriptional activator
MTHVHFRLLGPPQIQLDGRPVELGTRKVVALLAYLAVTAAKGRPLQSRAVLAALWLSPRKTRSL